MEAKLEKNYENPILKKFYKGWSGFSGLYVQDNYLVFKVASHKHMESATEAAEKRIKELNLPLKVLPSKFPINTFIVKEASHA